MLLKIKCTYESFGGLNECEACAGGRDLLWNFPHMSSREMEDGPNNSRSHSKILNPHFKPRHTVLPFNVGTVLLYMVHSTERTLKVDSIFHRQSTETWFKFGSPACRRVSRQPGGIHFSPCSTHSDQKCEVSWKQRQKEVEKGLCLGALLVRVLHVTYEWEVPVHYVMIHSEMRKTARLTAWAAGGRTFLP